MLVIGWLIHEIRSNLFQQVNTRIAKGTEVARIDLCVARYKTVEVIY